MAFGGTGKLVALATLVVLSAVTLLASLTYIAFQVSPWPSSIMVRRMMDQGDSEAAMRFEKHAPAGVVAALNEHYDAGDEDAYLDVFKPPGVAPTDRLPA